MARIVVLISGSGSNLQALIDAQKQGQLGEDAHIVSVISSSKKAYGLTRAADNNIPTRFVRYTHIQRVLRRRTKPQGPRQDPSLRTTSQN